MVRKFERGPLDPGVVDRILDHARKAPSAGFSQGFEFLVLEDQEERDRLWRVFDELEDGRWADPEIEPAALLIVPFANKDAYLDRYAEADKGWEDRDEARWPVPYWYIDTGFSALLMLLTAVDEGLGGLFFGVPPHAIAPLREAFGVPQTYVPIGVVAVGHRGPDAGSAGSAATRPRRAIEQVVHRGRW